MNRLAALHTRHVSKTPRELKLPAKRRSCRAGISMSDKQGTTREMEEVENESVSLTEGDNAPGKIFNASGNKTPRCGALLGFIRRKGSSTEAMLFVNCAEHRWRALAALQIPSSMRGGNTAKSPVSSNPAATSRSGSSSSAQPRTGTPFLTYSPTRSQFSACSGNHGINNAFSRRGILSLQQS